MNMSDQFSPSCPLPDQHQPGLQSHQEQLELLDAMPDLLFVLSREGVYLDCHAAHPDGSTMQPEQFLGKNVRDVMPGNDRVRLLPSAWRLPHPPHRQGRSGSQPGVWHPAQSR
jgi:PAS domain-containing protein